jgi:hypothetical protein
MIETIVFMLEKIHFIIETIASMLEKIHFMVDIKLN